MCIVVNIDFVRHAWLSNESFCFRRLHVDNMTVKNTMDTIITGISYVSDLLTNSQEVI